MSENKQISLGRIDAVVPAKEFHNSTDGKWLPVLCGRPSS